MARARRLLAESWAPSASVLLHGLALAALLMAVKPPTFPTSQEQAVPVTLVTLAPPQPQPVPQPVVAPPPPVIDEPPPVTTTSEAVAEIAQPRKPAPKKRVSRPKPQPKSEVRKPDPAPVASAPTTAEATPSAAPIGPTPQPSHSVGPSSSYLALLRQKLERNKVYPHTARARKEQGTALLRFVIDRSGHVLAHRLERGTGHRDLDREVEAMLDRAQPLPPMPAEMTQAQIELVVPVQFHLR